MKLFPHASLLHYVIWLKKLRDFIRLHLPVCLKYKDAFIILCLVPDFR
jgi:hypothetical protein